MSLDTIKKISEAEKQAEEIKAKATANARQIEADADSEAVRLINESANQAEVRRKQLIEAAVSNCGDKVNGILQAAEKSCAKLRQDTKKKMDKAVDAVYEKLCNAM